MILSSPSRRYLPRYERATWALPFFVRLGRKMVRIMGCESVRILLGDGKRHEWEAHGGGKLALAVVKAGEFLGPEDKGGRHMQNVERA
ncbi:MAG: hypothetical protein WCD63_21285, partial [Terrimicrobiaceae bacterium]